MRTDRGRDPSYRRLTPYSFMKLHALSIIIRFESVIIYAVGLYIVSFFQWIESRKAVGLGSNTLTLLQDLCDQPVRNRANSVGLVMRGLKKMGRDDVLGMLRKHLQG